eukprot:403355309
MYQTSVTHFYYCRFLQFYLCVGSSTPISDGETKSKRKYEKTFDIDISIVVPAYNEESRLPTMMKDTLEYLQKKIDEGKLFRTAEIVIVNDGSKDKTMEQILEYTRNYPTSKKLCVRGVNQVQNQGKGSAVKQGSLYSRGRYILFTDADGATDIRGLDTVFNECKSMDTNGKSCAIGSRKEDGSQVERHALRNFLSWVMHKIVQFVLKNNIKDTQCGFKIFTRDAAKLVFPTQHLERWSFDVEVLYLLGQQRVPVREVGVVWNEIEGSHLNVVEASIQMLRDMFLIKFLYTVRLWRQTDVTY